MAPVRRHVYIRDTSPGFRKRKYGSRLTGSRRRWSWVWPEGGVLLTRNCLEIWTLFTQERDVEWKRFHLVRYESGDPSEQKIALCLKEGLVEESFLESSTFTGPDFLFCLYSVLLTDQSLRLVVSSLKYGSHLQTHGWYQDRDATWNSYIFTLRVLRLACESPEYFFPPRSSTKLIVSVIFVRSLKRSVTVVLKKG